MKRCWIYRQAISWAIDSQAHAPRWVERHLHTCPECRHFYWAETHLVAALTADENTPLTEYPPFLHSKIMATLAAKAPGALQRGSTFQWIQNTLLPALGVFLIAVYGVWKFEHRPSASLGLASPIAEEPGQWMPQSSPGQLLAWSEKLDQPLENELNLVVRDAKGALQSLSDAFLPRRLLAQSDGAMSVLPK